MDNGASVRWHGMVGLSRQRGTRRQKVLSETRVKCLSSRGSTTRSDDGFWRHGYIRYSQEGPGESNSTVSRSRNETLTGPGDVHIGYKVKKIKDNVRSTPGHTTPTDTVSGQLWGSGGRVSSETKDVRIRRSFLEHVNTTKPRCRGPVALTDKERVAGITSVVRRPTTTLRVDVEYPRTPVPFYGVRQVGLSLGTSRLPLSRTVQGYTIVLGPPRPAEPTLDTVGRRII